MGASLNTGGRRGGTRRRRRMMSDINVTPMVDVMLVLLIIFMVTAPLLTTGVTVDLPRASSAALKQDTKPVTVSIAPDGRLYLQNQKDTPISEAQLRAQLTENLRANPELRIYVRGDGGVPYHRVMEVMGMLRDAGIDKVSLITQLPTPQPAGQR